MDMSGINFGNQPSFYSGQTQAPQQNQGPNLSPDQRFQIFASQNQNMGIMSQGGQFGGGLDGGQVPSHPIGPPQSNGSPIMGTASNGQSGFPTQTIAWPNSPNQPQPVDKVLSPQQLNGNFETLWKEVRSELESQGFSIWRRKKALGETLESINTNQSISMSDLIGKIRDRAPIMSEMGRQRPGWDNVFSAIRCGKGQHRRHIVMSSVMRMAAYKVFDSVGGNQNLQNKLGHGLAGITNHKEKCEGKTPTKFTKPQNLELAIVSKFHNNKANIFLGQGGYNSAIGGLAHQAEKIEEETLNKLKGTTDKTEIIDIAEGWVDNMRNASVFGNNREKFEIVNVLDQMIGTIVGEAMSAQEMSEQISDVIQMFYDTMANDLSEANNSTLKVLQNNTLMKMQIEFLKVCASPDVDKFLHLAANFMKVESFALQELGIDEAKLYAGNQTEIQKLQKAV